MRIVHICLASAYNDGWGYQENILAQMHSQMGLEVFVLTSDYVINKDYVKVPVAIKEYTNAWGIHIKSLERSKRYGWLSRCKDFANVFNELEQITPDIIFVHGGQFLSLKDVVTYCRKNRHVRLYIDNHADYYNISISTWKAKIVQKYLFGFWMRRAEKYCNKFWGVTPWRCEYLHDVYGISYKKIGLLVMGGDDNYIHLENKKLLRREIRTTLNLNDDDFVIITGGKIDKTKNVHLLMQAVAELNIDNLKLIVFGQPNSEMSDEIKSLSRDSHIRWIGWIDSTKVYDYFLSSDLAVFPGTHSVLWEQACACGIPCVCKYWEKMDHVDVGGNCYFLKTDSIDEIKSIISYLLSQPDEYCKMKEIAIKEGVKTFSYREIAKRAIEFNKGGNEE